MEEGREILKNGKINKTLIYIKEAKMYTSGWELIAYIFAAIVGLVLLFAQVKMFSIDAKLSKILEIMEKKKESKIEG